MRNMVLKDNRRWNLVALGAWGVTGLLSLAIAGNAIFGQPNTGRSLAAARLRAGLQRGVLRRADPVRRLSRRRGPRRVRARARLRAP